MGGVHVRRGAEGVPGWYLNVMFGVAWLFLLYGAGVAVFAVVWSLPSMPALSGLGAAVAGLSTWAHSLLWGLRRQRDALAAAHADNTSLCARIAELEARIAGLEGGQRGGG